MTPDGRAAGGSLIVHTALVTWTLGPVRMHCPWHLLTALGLDSAAALAAFTDVCILAAGPPWRASVPPL